MEYLEYAGYSFRYIVSMNTSKVLGYLFQKLETVGSTFIASKELKVKSRPLYPCASNCLLHSSLAVFLIMVEPQTRNINPDEDYYRI